MFLSFLKEHINRFLLSNNQPITFTFTSDALFIQHIFMSTFQIKVHHFLFNHFCDKHHLKLAEYTEVKNR